MGYNKNVGGIQYEPQSVEGPGSYPQGGPADGKIASAQKAQTEQLDVQNSTRWARQNIVAGPRRIKWHNTAPHVTKKWQYWITKDGWNTEKPLKRDTFELIKEIDGKMLKPNTVVEHDIVIPATKRGYHILLGIWDIGDTTAAFYSAVDLHLHADSSTITNRITFGDDNNGSDNGGDNNGSDNGGGNNGSDNGGGNNGSDNGGGNNGSDNGGGNNGSDNGGGNNSILSKPITRATGSVLHWDSVNGANGYQVLRAGNETIDTTDTKFSVVEYPGVQYLSLRAVNKSQDNKIQTASEWTPWIILLGGVPENSTPPDQNFNLDAPKIELTGRLLVWPAVDKASQYQVVVNGIHSNLDQNTLFIEIPYTPGRHSIFVRAVDGNNNSAWASFTRTITDEFGNTDVLTTPQISLDESTKKKSSHNHSSDNYSKFVVSHNGIISFYDTDKVSLADLGLTVNDIKSGKHDVRIQALNGQTSSEWSTPLHIQSNPQEGSWIGVLAISIGSAIVLVVSSILIRKSLTKKKYK
jgi:hypothetical protein